MKALLFDFGGTIDTGGVHWSEKFRDAYGIAGLDIPRRDYEAAYVAVEAGAVSGRIRPVDGLTRVLECQVRMQFEHLREHHSGYRDRLGEEQVGTVAAICRDEVLSNVRAVRPILETLGTRYRLGLVSNYYGNLPSVCEELGIESLFDSIVDSAVVGVRKPDPLIFSIAMRKLGALSPETAVIGDSYDRDIQPAKSIGCFTIWLRGRSWKIENRQEDADRIIVSLNELIHIIPQEQT